MSLVWQLVVHGTVGFVIGAGTNDLAIRWLFATFFRRTFFRKGLSAKLPDDTPFCVRYKNGRADFSFGSFDTEESSTDKITF